MKPAQSARACAMGALVVLTLATSTLGLIALNRGGEARLGSVRLLRLAAGYDRRAERLLAKPGVNPATDQEAAQLSRDALEQFPYDTSAWLRLVYVDYRQHGQLTPVASAQLQRTYDLVQVDPEVGIWRITFALENSHFLSPELRASARREAIAFCQTSLTCYRVKALAPVIQSPAGRLSLALWLRRIQLGVTQ